MKKAEGNHWCKTGLPPWESGALGIDVGQTHSLFCQDGGRRGAWGTEHKEAALYSGKKNESPFFCSPGQAPCPLFCVLGGDQHSAQSWGTEEQRPPPHPYPVVMQDGLGFFQVVLEISWLDSFPDTQFSCLKCISFLLEN